MPYDVELLNRVGMDIEFPTIFHVIGWEKLNEAPRSRSHSCLLTLEFLRSFDSFTRVRKLCSFSLFLGGNSNFSSHFSELMDFSNSCMLEEKAMKMFSRI
jgi:hypothetical protein